MNRVGRPDNTERGRTRPLTSDETRRFFQTAKAEGSVNFLFLTLCYTFGMRVSEAVALRREDVDVKARRLTIKALKGGLTTTQNVPADTWRLLAVHLKRLPKFETWLFPARTRTSGLDHMSAQAAKMLFKRVAAAAGLSSRLGIHSLRATLGHRLAEAGMNVQRIAGALRHADLHSSLRYTSSVVDEVLDDAVERVVRRVL